MAMIGRAVGRIWEAKGPLGQTSVSVASSGTAETWGGKGREVADTTPMPTRYDAKVTDTGSPMVVKDAKTVHRGATEMVAPGGPAKTMDAFQEA